MPQPPTPKPTSPIVNPINTQSHESHGLYKEAIARASQPQPLIVHNTPKSILLTSPNNIIFELFNTIVKEITSQELNQYIIDNLKQYLSDNWTNKALQNAILRLRRERELDRRAKSPSGVAPNIGKKSSNLKSNLNPGSQSNTSNQDQESTTNSLLSTTKSGVSISGKQHPKDTFNSDAELIDQVNQHILWRISSQKVTQITSLIIKFAIDDGYKRGRIKAQVYDDVKPNFADWRSDKLIKLYSFGNLPPNDQRLILANTSVGKLTKYVANYIDGSEKKENNELIRILASALRDKTKNCILLTNDLDYAMKSLGTNSLRSVFILDRDNNFEENFNQLLIDTPQLNFLTTSGKIYFMNSLNCVQFVPDPTTMECC